MKQSMRCRIAALAVTAAACVGTLFTPVGAHAQTGDYQIFPTPQKVAYQEGSVEFADNVTTVVEDGIDAETEARLEEAVKLKAKSVKSADAVPANGTAVLVGVHGSGKQVDSYVKQLVDTKKLTYDAGLFEQTDANLVALLPAEDGAANRIIVLGKDTDSAFYGLSTVFQILQQDADSSLRSLVASDHADVISRGFIEGYYGNPWSTRDRVALMEWGGYYKLNAYFYAPKDDPKHNSQWREKYTQAEIDEKIKPLAEAGNKSKVRFVYALHPFMHNPITKDNYDETFKIMKAKFLQVIDAGTRQIAILADDAGYQLGPNESADKHTGELYKRLLDDTTAWLRELQNEKNPDGTFKYPGLKDTLIFCPVDYMGHGESWYRTLGENVQVINTGGRVWGKIDNAFATTFKNNSGVAPFMWINWPCSDNDKDALHMGGHNNFLGSDLKPGQVKGVVINPMQQSEPSKQGIFMTADFTWNLWGSTEHADQVWEKSFSYIDHNSGKETEGSNALRELSGHMKRMYGGGATWENDESADIKQELADFRAKLSSDTVTAADVDKVSKIFLDLQRTAKTYRDNAGTKAMAEQMKPWLDTWDDLTAAALTELEAVKAGIEGDASALVSKYAEGAGLLERANGHALWYINHYEYARVGKAHITPMVLALDAYTAEKATLAADPDAVVTKLVTSRTDTPVGSTAAVFDGDPKTGAVYQSPNKLVEGDYFGMVSSKPFDLKSVTFIQGGGKDFMDASKVQYLKGGQWTDVEGSQEFSTSKVSLAGLNIEGVEGVRIIAVRDNRQDAWPTINEIMVNKQLDENAVFTGAVSIANQVSADGSKPLQHASDGKDTEAWFRFKDEGEDRDTTAVDAAVQVTFDSPKTITSITFKQGGGSDDVIESGKAYYQDVDGFWHEAGVITSAKSQTIQLAGPVSAKAIKVVNGVKTAKWWRVVDLHAGFGKIEATATATTNMPQYQNNPIVNVVDGNADSKFWSNRKTQANDYVMLSFSAPKFIDTVYLKQGDADKFTASKLYYTTDAAPAADGKWTELPAPTSASEQTITFDRVEATGVKLVSTAATDSWFQLFEFNAFEKFSYSKDSLYASFDLAGVNLAARVGDGSFKTTDGSVTLPKKGDVIAVDLGSVRREVVLANADAQVAKGAELVYSQNGIEWSPLKGADPVRARYVGYRATADAASVDFKALTGSYLHSLAPSIVKSELPGAQTLDAAKIFDGNVATATKSSGGPSEGTKVVFDLGQERSIKSVEYFVPETSLDYIRNAVIEVADRADAPDAEWKTVLDINSDGKIAAPGKDVPAKEAKWMTHSTDFPGNMFIKSGEGVDETARFIRIRFTKAYAERWFEIGELRINGGEYVPVYAGGDFETTAVEQQGKTPDNLLDKSVLTAWQPATDEAGTLAYHVSEPFGADGAPFDGVRVISKAAQPAVKVKAVVYSGDLRAGEPATKTVELGVLDSVLKDLSFGKGVSAVKDIVFEWPKGTVPQISEIFLTRGVDASLDGDIEALRDLVAKAKTVDTAAWTTDSVTALDKAVVAAEEALKAPESLAYQQIVDLKAGIEGALSSPVLKYAGTELQQLIDNAVADGSKFTPESWKAYQDALDAAKAGLENADNLSQAEGDRLARELKDALAALVENADQGGSGSGNGGSGNGGAGNGGQGGNSNGNGANGSTGKPGSSSDKLVQTGDDSLMLIGGTAAAAVALAGAGIALKRRRSNA